MRGRPVNGPVLHLRLGKTSAVLWWVVPLISGHYPPGRRRRLSPRVTYGKGQNTCAHSSWHISGTNKVTGNQQLIVLTVKTGTSKAIATGHPSGSYQGEYSSVEFQRTTPHTPSPGFIFLLPVLQYSDREQQYLERNLTAKKQTSRNAQLKQECRTGSEAFTCE